MLAPVLAVLALVVQHSVDVPYIDDYDAIIGFLRLYDDTASAPGRLGLLVSPHNEHGMLMPRLAALATRAARGYLDYRWLNLLGTAQLLLFVVALFLCFRRGERAADKLLPFAPAVLLLVHPQFWMMYLSPTTALSSFSVVALAALAFAFLDRGGWRRLGLAAALACTATLTLANGFLVFPLGLVVPALHRRWRELAAWAVLAALLLALAFAVLPPPAPRGELLELRPDRLATYALNFVGCAAGFSQSGVSLAAGALLLLALAGATAGGLPRRSPALFALLLFLLAGAAANTLARAALGAELPLIQPRYAFYASALLALAYLAWAEVARDARRAGAAALAASMAFSLASFHLYRGEVARLSQGLAEGFERWWVEGDGGLFYPSFRPANTALLAGLDAGWLRLPAHWLERHADWPTPRAPPPATGGVRIRLDVVAQDEGALYVSGVANAGGTRDQEVELVLRAGERALVFPAHSIPRADLEEASPEVAGSLLRTGFRALIPKQALPAGRYTLGILVRHAGGERLSYRRRPIEITAP